MQQNKAGHVSSSSGFCARCVDIPHTNMTNWKQTESTLEGILGPDAPCNLSGPPALCFSYNTGLKWKNFYPKNFKQCRACSGVLANAGRVAVRFVAVFTAWTHQSSERLTNHLWETFPSHFNSVLFLVEPLTPTLTFLLVTIIHILPTKAFYWFLLVRFYKM